MKSDILQEITAVETFLASEDSTTYYMQSFVVLKFFGMIKIKYKAGWWISGNSGKNIGPLTEQELMTKYNKVVKGGKIFNKPYAKLYIKNKVVATVYFKNCTEMVSWTRKNLPHLKKKSEQDIW